MNNKLQAKDLINIGLFTVLYFVLGCCVAIPIGFVPIFLPVLGSLWTLITGIPLRRAEAAACYRVGNGGRAFCTVLRRADERP